MSGSFTQHDVPIKFFDALQEWLAHLRTCCTLPEQIAMLDDTAAAFRQAEIKLLMDAGRHKAALERINNEVKTNLSEFLETFYIHCTVQCMLCLEQEPWGWLKGTLTAKHCKAPYADILALCIEHCKCMRPDQQADV